MININALLKILYKPKKAFEQIAADTKMTDGLMVWAGSLALGLLLFAIAMKRTGLNLMAVTFGFGAELTWASFFIGVARGLAIIFFVAYFGGFLAKKLKGSGDHKRLASLMGYSHVLAVPQAVASVIILGQFSRKIAALVQQTLAEQAVDPAALFSSMTLIIALNIIFCIWGYYLASRAVSAAYSIPLWKGILCAMASYFVIGALFTGVYYLAGYGLLRM